MQAAGPEKEEIVGGEHVFGKDVLGGPSFGTEKDPVLVYSALGERVIGCIGR